MLSVTLAHGPIPHHCPVVASQRFSCCVLSSQRAGGSLEPKQGCYSAGRAPTLPASIWTSLIPRWTGAQASLTCWDLELLPHLLQGSLHGQGCRPVVPDVLFGLFQGVVVK